MNGLGRTWPNYVGWVHMLCEQWRAGRDEAGEKKGKKGWPAVVVVVGGATRVDKQRRWGFAAAGGAATSSSSLFCFSFFSLLLLLLFFSFFRSSPSLLFSCSLLFSFFSLCPLLSLSSFFFLLLPCFYRQKQGRDMVGAATVLPPLHRPSNTWKVVGVFLEGVGGGDRGRKNLLLPPLRASRGRRRPTVPFKTTPFRPLFFFWWNGVVFPKTRRFI